MIIPKPKKIKLELMSDEIGYIIEELERVPYLCFIFLHYEDIVKKLRKALK